MYSIKFEEKEKKKKKFYLIYFFFFFFLIKEYKYICESIRHSQRTYAIGIILRILVYHNIIRYIIEIIIVIRHSWDNE